MVSVSIDEDVSLLEASSSWTTSTCFYMPTYIPVQKLVEESSSHRQLVKLVAQSRQRVLESVGVKFQQLRLQLVSQVADRLENLQDPSQFKNILKRIKLDTRFSLPAHVRHSHLPIRYKLNGMQVIFRSPHIKFFEILDENRVVIAEAQRTLIFDHKKAQTFDLGVDKVSGIVVTPGKQILLACSGKVYCYSQDKINQVFQNAYAGDIEGMAFHQDTLFFAQVNSGRISSFNLKTHQNKLVSSLKKLKHIQCPSSPIYVNGRIYLISQKSGHIVEWFLNQQYPVYRLVYNDPPSQSRLNKPTCIKYDPSQSRFLCNDFGRILSLKLEGQLYGREQARFLGVELLQEVGWLCVQQEYIWLVCTKSGSLVRWKPTQEKQ